MIQVLIIDDEAVRIPRITEWIMEQTRNTDIQVTHSITFRNDFDAFDMVMLDHDLGANGDVYDNVRKEFPTGYHGNATIVIHSMNPVGAANIQAQLGTGVRVPYSGMR